MLVFIESLALHFVTLVHPFRKSSMTFNIDEAFAPNIGVLIGDVSTGSPQLELILVYAG